MTAAQQGHRDAAQGVADNPFDPVTQPGSHGLWLDAKERVEAFTARGLDPNGHSPLVPHLCSRDITKVCNCCNGCTTGCWAEKFEGTSKRIESAARGLLRKLIGR